MARVPNVQSRLAAACWLAAVAFGVWAVAWFPVSRVAARGTHALAIEEFGAGVPITQVFSMTADGLEGVRVQLTASSPTGLRLEYRVSTMTDGRFVERYRAARDISLRTGPQWITLDFRTLEHSVGTTVALEIRALRVQPHAPGPEGPGLHLALMASRDRPLRQSDLLVGGRERWGSLQFEARAAGDTVLGRFRLNARERLPGWLRQPPVLAGGLLVYAVLFMAAIGALLPRTASPVSATPRRIGMGIAVCGLLVAALGSAIWVARAEHGRINLIDELYEADLHPSSTLHETFDVLNVEAGSESHRALMAIPLSRVVWRLTLPSGARLDTAVALIPMAWTMPGDGAYFRISVERSGRSTDVFARLVDPGHVAADQRWIPVTVDLSPFAGAPVDLVFATEASAPRISPPDPSNDFAVWGEPRITGR